MLVDGDAGRGKDRMQALLDHLIVAPFMVVTVLAFAVAIRRVLGVPVGTVRTLLAAVFAVLIAGPLLQAMQPVPTRDGTTLLLSLVLSICAASLLAMVLLVLAEVLVPTGSLPGPVELWRGWRGRLDRTRRYGQIVRIALRHGLARFLRGRTHRGLGSSAARRRLARSVREALDEGGVTFVKLGQQLSVRRDLIPPEFADELTGLQDHAAPIPWPEVQAVLVAEWGTPVESVVDHLDRRPLAAASIAQVHTARLPDGEAVVVKVQRPGASTSWVTWPGPWSRARSGDARSASSGSPTASPRPCARNSTSPWSTTPCARSSPSRRNATATMAESPTWCSCPHREPTCAPPGCW
jgi:ubiquinone biosynthesis protein